jgi:hypothetical protein
LTPEQGSQGSQVGIGVDPVTDPPPRTGSHVVGVVSVVDFKRRTGQATAAGRVKGAGRLQPLDGADAVLARSSKERWKHRIAESMGRVKLAQALSQRETRRLQRLLAERERH